MVSPSSKSSKYKNSGFSFPWVPFNLKPVTVTVNGLWVEFGGRLKRVSAKIPSKIMQDEGLKLLVCRERHKNVFRRRQSNESKNLYTQQKS